MTRRNTGWIQALCHSPCFSSGPSQCPPCLRGESSLVRLGLFKIDAHLASLFHREAIEHTATVIPEVDVALAQTHRRILFAKGVALPVLRAEDAGHIGMVREPDAQHVVDLTFHPVGAGIEGTGAFRNETFGNKDPQAEPPTAADAGEV